jgi:hypothetical protein
MANLEAFQQYQVLYWIWNQILSCIHVSHLWLGHPEDCFLDKGQRLLAYSILHKSIHNHIGNLQKFKRVLRLFIFADTWR